ncbi:hypothetical protein SAMN02745127_02773 [Oceanospirillum multiglobuliferum]|uniref:Uncharacterized protein n=1 Tax=Oceanospirillum multiglobuliferum TaxID=64969 RepID=A0A1T4S5E5_9GAMM|nr:YacL family protein [Oceanospirillum multiglobuliferum]OPX54460.1 hypothetical protein BTE48_14180 [Oceanospirillum multiglobuliferum]SKA23445.1 hypothetical protein SAMN02745127_02773 [Oceanospirillum multiglobuliferum]
MEYDFTRDKDGRLTAELSMGHEAFGHWLNSEKNAGLPLLEEIEQTIAKLQSGEIREKQFVGTEYSLQLSQDEVEVRANHLFYADDYQNQEEQDEALSNDDEQSFAACGLDDFSALLSEWREFVERYA